MSAEPQRRCSVEEYLALDRESEVRHEYLDGELFAMAGASREHNLIAWNVAGTLHPQLKARGCEGYVGDMRTHVVATGLYTYPEVVVVCGDPAFAGDSRDVLTNPTLVVEILSPSTEDYDRGRKFAHYRTVPSLRAYLLVAQDRVHAELSVRQPDGRWLLWETDDPAAVLELEAIGATLPLAEVYDGVLDLGISVADG